MRDIRRSAHQVKRAKRIKHNKTKIVYNLLLPFAEFSEMLPICQDEGSFLRNYLHSEPASRSEQTGRELATSWDTY